MKKAKCLVGFILIFSLAFVFNVKADNKIVSSFPSSISGYYDGMVTQDGVNIYKKFYSDGRAFCTLFWNDFKSGTCTATWWSKDNTENKKIAVAVGTMINKARSLSGGSTNQIDRDVYFYTEMAINYFLYNYNGKHSVNNVSKLVNWSTVSNRSTYKTIYAAGTTAYNDYGGGTAKYSNAHINDYTEEQITEENETKKKATITATADFTCYDSKGNKIKCAARCKKTAKIKVTYSDGTTSEQSDINSSCPKSSAGQYYTYSASATFKYAVDLNITKVEATFNTENYTSYPVAQEYYCGSSSYQNLTPNLLKTMDISYPASKKVTKNIETCTIKLIKKDGTQTLSGAKFELYDGDAKIDTGVTNTNGVLEFDGLLPDKTYKYKEIKAPKGYVLNSAKVDVTCGETVVNNTKATGSLTIKKEDDSGNPVAGAKIRVYTISSSGASGTANEMTETNGYEGNNDGDYNTKDNNTYQINYVMFDGNDYFITTTTPKVITGLSLDETYYVEEESVPESSDYAVKVSSDSVKIVEAKNYEVKLINIHSNFKISKQDITTKKELPGAEIHITDIYGNEIEKWTSTTTPHEMKGLADGEYILTEITAPKGYKKAESIKFTIENGKLKDDSDNILVMYDDITKVIVPDTLSARNILIVIAGIAIVGVGLGTFLYGVKRKDQI